MSVRIVDVCKIESARRFAGGVRVETGHIAMPDLPGIGFEGKADLHAEMRALAS